LTDPSAKSAAPVPLGFIEPHGPLLQAPPSGQLLYKIMKAEHLLASIEGKYLHFNRVNSYVDFPDADSTDGEQLPGDRPGNAATRFAKAPDFSVADYYDRSRGRTYACCFSLENSNHIWSTYANGSRHGKVGLVFDFDKLRATLNSTLASGGAALICNGMQCRQFFSINYGVVEYVDRASHRTNETMSSNPIIYTYSKDRQFAKEKELRVSLSALGVGHFVLNDGTILDFPPSLQTSFDFGIAIGDGTIQEILCGPDVDRLFLEAALHKFGIGVK
jgi:hypothetical protein